MPTHQMASRHFYLYACLPFIELTHESILHFGPVVFWPASKAQQFLPENFFPNFDEYLQVVRQIKTRNQEQSLIQTMALDPKRITCISIAEEVNGKAQEFLLIDSLYLLYFACTFRNLYYGQETPPFNVFRKVIPAVEDFISNKKNWEELHILETDRENTICLNHVDPEICQGLGKALDSIYHPIDPLAQELADAYKRLVRSIRYLVDCVFQRFVNLLGKGLYFSAEVFEPEEIIFIASSFESLFNLDKSQEIAADFKHKLRPLLHLKYSCPIEIFWRWTDDFYELKRRILQGETFLDPLFRLNPNFEISHILLGVKLLIYSIYYYLFKYQLIQSTYVDSYTPPDFKWIHPEEILLFFWTEASVLDKISLFVRQAEQEAIKEEVLADMNLLTTLFVSLYDRYYLSEHLKEGQAVRFIPSSVRELKKDGNYLWKN